MPSKATTERARRDLREGKHPSTAAGEFVHEEIEHVRSGKHGARSTRQAIAIGLSKARRAGVPLRPPKKGRVKASTRRSAERDYEVGQGRRKPRAPSARRSRATEHALKREGRRSLAQCPFHARQARRRGAAAPGWRHAGPRPLISCNRKSRSLHAWRPRAGLAQLSSASWVCPYR